MNNQQYIILPHGMTAFDFARLIQFSGYGLSNTPVNGMWAMKELPRQERIDENVIPMFHRRQAGGMAWENYRGEHE